MQGQQLNNFTKCLLNKAVCCDLPTLLIRIAIEFWTSGTFACFSPLAMAGLPLRPDSVIVNQELPCPLSVLNNALIRVILNSQ